MCVCECICIVCISDVSVSLSNFLGKILNFWWVVHGLGVVMGQDVTYLVNSNPTNGGGGGGASSSSSNLDSDQPNNLAHATRVSPATVSK